MKGLGQTKKQKGPDLRPSDWLKSKSQINQVEKYDTRNIVTQPDDITRKNWGTVCAYGNASYLLIDNSIYLHTIYHFHSKIQSLK